ncbi:MAG TPA: sigma-70 family RNA polymerase sigma factor [Acidobacteriota bacterium]|nr:sigma-70 family RNA polymerase sigma factor [Acidobacteriota bacterium]
MRKKPPLSRKPDTQWIEEAIDRFQGRLIRYAWRLLGDPEEARDVVQHVFCKLCREDPARLNGHLAPWLYTVCRNRALDVLRFEQRFHDGKRPLDQRPGHEPSPLRRLEVREELSQIENLLEKLPRHKREVVLLKYDHGFSYRQISQITGLSESNVGFILHTVLKEVRGKLASPPSSQTQQLGRIQ